MPNELQGLLGGMQATPRNKLMGLLADGLKAADRYANKPDPTMPGGKANPPLSLLSDLASLKSLAEVANNVSYGYPLTNKGVANVPFLKPETADALMMAPISPRNALAAAALGLGMADNGAMRAATVWHGSPHKFDKFDASKIGTGEGAQAYGHGLYLAESPAVAGQYKSALSGPATTEVGGAAIDSLGLSANARSLVNQVAGSLQRGGKMDDEIAGLELNIKYGHPDAAAMREALAVLRKGVDRGNLYKVDLPDDAIAKMLDWDKPLSQQAESLAKLSDAELYNLGITRGGADAFTGNPLTGGDLMKFSDNQHGGGWLHKKGIPGLRYLDGGSRGAGHGSSNFVVFPGNEGLLSILERNGQPLK